MRRSILPAVWIAVVVAVACHKSPPQTAVAPTEPDTAALAERQRADSIAAAAAARAREDSIRLAEQRHADSIASARQMQRELEASLTTLIHFDFDKAMIRVIDDSALDQKVALLRANPALRIRIAGNCDERGSTEYNLALGNRRAMAAKRYLADHGVDPSRIETVSYGEERPLDAGHNETAWAMNRNDQFVSITPSVVLISP